MRALILAVLLSATMPSVAATIVLDTGHSPTAPGSRAADGTPEFKLNRAFSASLAKHLVARGHRVLDVRARGYDRSLLSRVVDTPAADLFLSVHHDSIQQSWLDAGRAEEFAGFAVFVSAKSKKLRPSLRCALGVADGMLAAGELPSKYHATPIPGENRPLLDAARGIHRYDNLAVLKHSEAPAVLLEVGVGINPRELAKLCDPRWVDAVADRVAEGVDRCTQGQSVSATPAEQL